MNDLSILHAFKHMSVALMIVGPEGEILRCNAAASDLFGFTENELIGRSALNILPLASTAELNAFIVPPRIDTVIKGMKGCKKDGTLITLGIQMTAWHESESGLHHALVLRDISAELTAEQNAKAALTRADNALIGARIGIFEYSLPDRKIVMSDMSRALLEIDTLVERDILQTWAVRVHPDDHDVAREPVLSCISGNTERAHSVYRYRANHNERWRWIRTDVAVSDRNSEGKVVKVAGAVTDISNEKETEQAFRRSVAQFRSAFRNATIGMAIVGLNGEWLRVNPALCELLGFSDAELLQTDFQTLTHPDDLYEDLEKMEELKSGVISTYNVEKRFFRSSGAVMWGRLSVGAVYDQDGNPEHFVSQIVDITEERRLSELKNQFVSTVSHELRTPLTSVLGALSLLTSMDEEPFSDQAQRLLYIAEQNGNRLHALINDTLDFEKFSARQMRITLSRHLIVPMVEESVLANTPLGERYRVRFNVIAPKRDLRGLTDPKRFHQIMANLLSNAAKFADEESIVDIQVSNTSDHILVSITNDGEGIPMEFQDKIFKPFSQATPSETRSRPGTGLGLSIVKHIVEQAGGKIGFDSRNGGPTTFWFTVPLVHPQVV